MKLHRSNADENFRISGYGDGFVVVAEQRVEASFALHAGQIHPLQDFRDPDALEWGGLEFMHEAPPEILVFGTGVAQCFPRPELYAQLASRRIGLEVMSTPAACRTYNILAAEGRKVSALMLIRERSNDC